MAALMNSPKLRSTPAGLLVAVGSVAVATVLVYPLKSVAPTASAGMVYLLPVLAVSILWNRWVGLFAALLSALAFNLFHIQPTGTLSVNSAENLVALIVFLLVAAITSGLAELSRSRAREAERRRREADLTADLAGDLLAGRVSERLPVASARLAENLELGMARIAIEPPDPDEGLDITLDLGDRSGRLELPEGTPHAEADRIVERVVPSIEAILKVALERDRLQDRAIEGAALQRSEELKTALIRSVSHDFRSPLAGILTSAEALKGTGLEPSEREEMADSIAAEAARLSRLVNNLLDLSRLESDAATPRRDWSSLEELIETSADEARRRNPGAPVRTNLTPGTRLARIDPVQTERVMPLRGRHRVLLGMAPGVGKTYRMLQEGRAGLEEGHDIVIGYLEPHDRPDTAALAEGMEMIPRRTVEVGSASLPEMDLDAVLARRPAVALVDELAHTNAPGSTHAKRHEDVLDLLDAGINVISTVNVQHLESLNDQLADLTGVRVRETLPDDVLKRADEIVLIDLTPQDLIERLREGKVYPRDRVEKALNSFFKVENLSALREVALRQVAEDVENRRLLRASSSPVRGQPDLRPSVAFSENMLALVRPDPSSQRLIRRAWRSARRLGATLELLWVAPPSVHAPESDPRLAPLRRLASILGIDLIVEPGDDLVRTVSEVARRRNTTYVLLGTPRPRRGPGRLRASLVDRLVESMPGVDVRIVSDRSRMRR